MKQTVFVVEDDISLQELYVYSLENEFECRCFGDSEAFFSEISKNLPDIVLLDIMLPQVDGFAILSQLKSDKITSQIPVIIVSAKGEEISKVKGLNMGADDYISKPFGVLELVARIKTNLRKTDKKMEEIAYKDILIDLSKHKITINNTPVKLTLKEFNLLKLLCQNAGKTQIRDDIFNKIWGEDFVGESRTLDIHIKELRKKLTDAKSEVLIETIRGVGYILS